MYWRLRARLETLRWCYVLSAMSTLERFDASVYFWKFLSTALSFCICKCYLEWSITPLKASYKARCSNYGRR